MILIINIWVPGFLISPTKIVTASHVIESTDELTALFTDGEIIKVERILRFESSDLAIVELEKPKTSPVTLKLGNASEVKIGEKIFLIGAPFGLRSTLSIGHLTGRRKNNNYKNPFFNTDFLQTDAVVNSGSSGAPLFDMNGEVIGVVSHYPTQSGNFQGIGFAIDIKMVKDFLLNKDSIWSNAQLYFVNKEKLQEIQKGMPQKSGLLVVKLDSPSIYDDLGLKEGYQPISVSDIDVTYGGDIILAFNDIEVEFTETAFTEINAALETYAKKGKLRVKVLRNGSIIHLENCN